MSKNKCSLTVVKNGRRLSGTAAILHMTSREGGFDRWLEDYTENVVRRVTKTVVDDLMRTQQKPKLKVV